MFVSLSFIIPPGFVISFNGDNNLLIWIIVNLKFIRKYLLNNFTVGFVSTNSNFSS
jgi:hypothetical protein